jgi:ABC-type amino acid transport substrate-binding protein
MSYPSIGEAMKVSTVLAVIFIAVLSAFVTVRYIPQSVEITKEESSYDRIMRTGVVRCGYLVWEPAVIKDPNTGQLSGVVYDLYKKVFDSLDLKVEWIEANIATYIEDLNSGKYDVECAGGFPTALRGKHVAYTKPLFYAPFHFFVRTDSPLKSVDEINDPKVRFAVMDGDATQYYRQEYFPNSTVINLPGGDLSQVMLQVVYGKADVTIWDALSAEPLLRSHEGQLRPLANNKINAIAVNMSVPHSEVALLNMLNTAITELHQFDSIRAVVKNYKLAPDAVVYYAEPLEQ